MTVQQSQAVARLLGTHDHKLATGSLSPAGTGLVIEFAEYGGNVNLEVNGDFRNESTFGDVVSPVGGVAVSCAGAGCAGGGQGTLYLVGTVTSVRIGGQEFCIDDICPRRGD